MAATVASDQWPGGRPGARLSGVQGGDEVQGAPATWPPLLPVANTRAPGSCSSTKAVLAGRAPTPHLSATMRLLAAPLLLVVLAPAAKGQIFNAIRNFFQPVTSAFQNPGGLFGAGGNFRDDGTARPQATGQEELFPSDCGRNTDSGTGKLCFPDGLLCRDREYATSFLCVKASQKGNAYLSTNLRGKVFTHDLLHGRHSLLRL